MTRTKKPAGIRDKGTALLAAAALAFTFGLTGCGEKETDDIISQPLNRLENPDITGRSLEEALALIRKDTSSIREYSITLAKDEKIAPQDLENANRAVEITLKGGGKTVTLNSYGTLFTVKKNITLTLSDITLEGKENNTKSLVEVKKGGTMIMSTGSVIRGNTVPNDIGGGVYVDVGGILTLNGGEISGNEAEAGGGVVADGTFTMNSGTIRDNTANWSGAGGGGGVAVGGTFIMRGGTISGNTTTASNGGGGVYVGSDDSTFTMSGGTISGNTATIGSGGGVYVNSYAAFTKTSAGGTIYGGSSGTDPNKASAAQKGHAVFFKDNNKYRDTTVSSSDTLSTSNLNSGWNQ